MAVIRCAERNGTRRPWLVQLMARRTSEVAAVAPANKAARMVRELMTNGDRYREPVIAWSETRRAIADEAGKGDKALMHKAG